MGEVYLGVLRGYSDAATNEYGNFYMYFKYENIYRNNDGNSHLVTFYNCYIEAVPFYTDRYTTNTIYIDSVHIYDVYGWQNIGISGSWKGNKSSTAAQGYITSKVSPTLTFNIGTGNSNILMYGHRDGTTENSQALQTTIYFDQGWSHVDYPYANGVKDGDVWSGNANEKLGDNGDNSITIIMTEGDWTEIDNGINTSFTNCGLNYKFMNTPSSDYVPWQECLGLGAWWNTKPFWKVYIPPNSTYLHLQDVFASGNDVNGNVRTIWGTGNDRYVKHYSKPGVPALDINAESNGEIANITIRATKGSDGENNPAVGVTVGYSINGNSRVVESSEGNLTVSFSTSIDNIKLITAYANTYGTQDNKDREVYIDNTLTTKESIYYSDEVSVNTANTNITNPSIPSGLQITDLGNNSFSIQCEKGADGTNNSSVGVDIYYTTDGTSPLNGNSIKSSATKYEGGTINITQDATVNVVARTVGAHPSYKYSGWTDVKQKKVLFYKTPDISDPVITTEDKKLNKKSIINVNQQLKLYQNTQLNSCQIGLYKDGNNNGIYDDSPIQYEIQDIKFPFDYGKNASGSYECHYKAGSIKQTNNISYTVQRDGTVKARIINNQSTSEQDNFYLNNDVKFGTSNGINLISGKIYYVKDCVVCYSNGGNIVYVEHGSSVQWKSEYVFMCAYIRIDSGGTTDTSNNKIKWFNPRIYHQETAIENITSELKHSDINCIVNHKFDLKKYNLNKDDKIYVRISYIINDGANNNLAQNLSKTSQMHTILSKGVVRVNVDGTWHEGQVWIYNDGWKEATGVFIKTNDGWKESV